VKERGELLELIKKIAVVPGRVTLSSGQEADYYIDLRRIGLHGQAAPLVGRVMRALTADWEYGAVGGLTLGADPVASAIMHASGGRVDAFVVRKTEKTHGLQRRIEGPDIARRSVLVVEDTSTTGTSPLTAVKAAREAGADVVGTALIVDRGGADAIRAAGLECRAAYSLADLGLS
jgi:orotate phosphoribosyltransferase